MSQTLALPQQLNWARQNAAAKEAARQRAREEAAKKMPRTDEARQVAREAEGNLTTQEMFVQAARINRECDIREKLLRQDIHAEKKSTEGNVYFPAAGSVFLIADSLNVVDLGTFSTILGWVMSVIVPAMWLYRAVQVARIQYSPERQKRRVKKLVRRQVLRALKRSLAVICIEAIPLINMIPAWIAAHIRDWLFNNNWQQKLSLLRLALRLHEQRIRRLSLRLRTPAARFQLAYQRLAWITALEQRFDKI